MWSLVLILPLFSAIFILHLFCVARYLSSPLTHYVAFPTLVVPFIPFFSLSCRKSKVEAVHFPIHYPLLLSHLPYLPPPSLPPPLSISFLIYRDFSSTLFFLSSPFSCVLWAGYLILFAVLIWSRFVICVCMGSERIFSVPFVPFRSRGSGWGLICDDVVELLCLLCLFS